MARARDPIVYIHALAPPLPGGTPTILLLVLADESMPPLITFTDLGQRATVELPSPRAMPGEHRYMLKIPPWNRLAIYRWPFGLANALLAATGGVRAGLRARRAGAQWILSVADEGYSPIAGAVASRVSGRPHLIWVFDLWQENALTDVERWLAARLERRIWRSAAGVLTHTPRIEAHYRAKHGTRSWVLPTPIDLERAGATEAADPGGSAGPTEILSGGAVYWAQEEALARLARVNEARSDTRLTLLGDADALQRKGITAEAVLPSLPQAEFQARVKQADILFLGLSFNSQAPDVIATATPARLVDYMASGRPLLIHAPADSHVAEYARSEDFAQVVDQPDDEALDRGLQAMLDDPDRAADRALRARRLVLEHHDVRQVRAKLNAILETIRR